MRRRNFFADATRRHLILADVPKRRLGAAVIARPLGAVEILPGTPGGGSPVCRSAVRTAALAATPPPDGRDRH